MGMTDLIISSREAFRVSRRTVAQNGQKVTKNILRNFAQLIDKGALRIHRY